MRLVKFFLLLLMWAEPAHANFFSVKPDIGKMMPPQKNREEAYHYGFNGKLKDNEWAGLGNHYDYGARSYDPRICRPISPDPLFKNFPSLSAYQFFSNSPIWAKDLDGKEAWYSNEGINVGEMRTNADGSFNLSNFNPVANGPLSTGYATQVGLTDAPTINLMEVEYKLNGGFTAYARGQASREITENNHLSGDDHSSAYRPWRGPEADAYGITISGSFVFGGGGSQSVSLGYMKGAGLFATATTSGGVGADVSVGVSLFAAYHNKTSYPDFSTFKGAGMQLSGGASTLVCLLPTKLLRTETKRYIIVELPQMTMKCLSGST